MLESIHFEIPGARIHLLVRKGNEGLFKNHPFLDELLVWDKLNHKLRGLLKLINTVRVNKYDAVINAHRFMSSGLITALSSARHKVGFDKNPMSLFFTNKVKHEFNGEHEIARNHLLLKPILNSKEPLKPKLYPSAEDEAAIAEYRSELFYCLFPASQWFTKQWPETRWVELADQLPANAMIHLMGGISDQEICEQIRSQSKRKESIIVLAGKLSLLQSTALMKYAKMNFTNDSSPTHLASSINAPVTVIYCSTVPAFGFGPLSDVSQIIETDIPLECRPCGLHGHRHCPKNHFNCGASIEASEAL
ncbi:MAG: glycosyltransferase family 9 protein [Flavobacteriales bacterium]